MLRIPTSRLGFSQYASFMFVSCLSLISLGLCLKKDPDIQTPNDKSGLGFDTTANSLAYASYLLAKHPEKQRRLIQEVDEHCKGEVRSFIR